MRLPRRGETFIALRAARTAHRVASEVLNPHLDVPEFQREVRHADEVQTGPLPRDPGYAYSCYDLTTTIVGLSALIAFVALLFSIGS